MPYYVFYNINEGKLGERFFRESSSFFVPDTCLCYELKEVAALNTAERRKTVRAKRPVQQRKVRTCYYHGDCPVRFDNKCGAIKHKDYLACNGSKRQTVA
jgi:hypothetical protein